MKTMVNGTIQVGSGYAFVDVPRDVVEPYRDQVIQHVGPVKASDMFHNLSQRPTGNGFHMTVFSPREFRQVKKNGGSVPEVFVTMDFVGVGRAVEGDKEAWFIVVDSPEAQDIRASMGFGPKEFHITLGFVNGDIFTDGVKGHDSIVA